MLSARKALRLPASLLLVVASLTGCKFGYILKQAGGQFRILTHRRAIEEVLRDPQLPEKEREKLRLVGGMKRYAEERVGLVKTDNYTQYYDTGGKPVAWSVVACPPDSLSPVTWWFPFVGSVSYLGYFDRADAEACRKEYGDDGFDTTLGTVAAYSTLGWFSDPIFSPMLKDSEGELANTIIHETTHATIYLSGKSEFNESLAEFVGDQGEIDYLTAQHGKDSAEVKASRVRKEDGRLFHEWIDALSKKLKAVYAQDRPRDEKLAEKKRILAEAGREYAAAVKRMRGTDFAGLDVKRLNNAWIASFATYHSDPKVFADVYHGVGEDLRRFVEFFQKAARTGDPMAHARRWLKQTPAERDRSEAEAAARRSARRPGRGS